MPLNLQKFVNAHMTVIYLAVFNIFFLLLFGILYFLCDYYDKTSFTSTISSPKYVITTFDHFLLSCAIQSGVGYANITPCNEKTKLLVFIQEFMVMTNVLVSIYLFIYLPNKK